MGSDWSWVGPWTLFMAAGAAFFTTDRTPWFAALLGVTILCGGWICLQDQRERERQDRQ